MSKYLLVRLVAGVSLRAGTDVTALNMELEVSLSSAVSVDSSSASSPSPSVNETHRSPRSDAEKLDMVCNYMRKELFRSRSFA